MQWPDLDCFLGHSGWAAAGLRAWAPWRNTGYADLGRWRKKVWNGLTGRDCAALMDFNLSRRVQIWK